MKIIYNKIIPFKGFTAINLFGVLFIRRGAKLSSILFTHELIHTKQMKELFYIFFYIWYLVEYIINLFRFKFNTLEAYRNISFEKEAYDNDNDFSYLKTRKKYSFLKYYK